MHRLDGKGKEVLPPPQGARRDYNLSPARVRPGRCPPAVSSSQNCSRYNFFFVFFVFLWLERRFSLDLFFAGFVGFLGDGYW